MKREEITSKYIRKITFKEKKEDGNPNKIH